MFFNTSLVKKQATVKIVEKVVLFGTDTPTPIYYAAYLRQLEVKKLLKNSGFDFIILK